MQALELLHNFTTRTFATLSDSTIIRDFYRQSAVQLGLRCDYIMRAVLAVSSLHLAYHRPEMRDHYRSLAMTHHQVASREASKAHHTPYGKLCIVADQGSLVTLMTGSDPSTAEKLFLFSVLTIYFALACPRKGDGALLVGESGYPEWMFLLQGTRAFIRILGTRVDGPVAPLFNHGADRWMAREPNAEPMSRVHEHLDSMRSMIVLRQADLGLRNTYLRAIDELAKSFSVFDGAGGGQCDLTDAFVWIFEVADDLLPLLREPTQEAVAIFAFFAVLLKRLEKHWWLRGWADHLIAKSHNLLDEEHRLWIQWPLQEIGYVS